MVRELNEVLAAIEIEQGNNGRANKVRRKGATPTTRSDLSFAMCNQPQQAIDAGVEQCVDDDRNHNRQG